MIVDTIGHVMSARSMRWDMSRIYPGLRMQVTPSANGVLEFTMDPHQESLDQLKTVKEIGTGEHRCSSSRSQRQRPREKSSAIRRASAGVRLRNSGSRNDMRWFKLTQRESQVQVWIVNSHVGIAAQVSSGVSEFKAPTTGTARTDSSANRRLRLRSAVWEVAVQVGSGACPRKRESQVQV